MTRHAPNRIRAVRLAAGLNQTELGDRAGTDYSTISKLERGVMKLTVDWMERLAGAMAVRPADLLVADGAAEHLPAARAMRSDKGQRKPKPRGRTGRPAQPFARVSPGYLPVYGLAAGSLVGQMQMTTEEIGEVAAPPGLVGVFGAYVLQTRGDSMIPRFFPNDRLYINPHQAVRAGDHVIIQSRTGNGTETFVKRFDGESDSEIITSQYNPPARITFRKAHVMHMHRVLPINELLPA